VHDIAEFLRSYPPFDALGSDELAAVAAAVQVEAHAGQSAIVRPADAPLTAAFVVRRGAVELLEDGELRDVLGEGELFGFASMLGGLPVGYLARAAEDTVLYRVPEAVIRPVLERPDAVPFLVRSLAAGGPLLRHPAPATAPADRPVRDLVRAAALVCGPEDSVRDAAERMAAEGATCVIVDAGDRLGIVTDRDLRTRVVATGAGADTPLSAVMTAPVHTIGADRLGVEAMLAMLDHGVRHLPVLDGRGRLAGVLDDVDLLAAERRAPFLLRARIARAPDADAVARAAAGLRPMMIELHDGRVGALTICRLIASIHDAAVRRLGELAEAELGPPPVPCTWLATGSFGRREPFPGSDSDSALAWNDGDDEAVRRPLRALAEQIVAGLKASGIRPCPERALASNPLFARSVTAWEQAAAAWLRDPDRDRGLMLLSVMTESAPVWGPTAPAGRILAALAQSPERGPVLDRVAANALALRPPTGLLHDFILEHSGDRKGKLDIKRGGVMPIVNLARWAALTAGVTAAPTLERLDGAESAGVLARSDADVLREAFELACALRMEHQVERLREGLEPDDLIDPAQLRPLTRSSLKTAFRAVIRVQRGIAVTLSLSPR